MADKIVNIDQLEEDLTAVANALRAKDGSEELLEYPDGFVDKINEFYSANDFTNLNKPVGIIYSETATSIPANAFYSRTKITQIILPNATSIDSNGIRECSNLISIRMDKLSNIKTAGIFDNAKIQTLVFPKLYSLSNSVCMALNSNLVAIDLGTKNVTTTSRIGNSNCFNGDTKLSTLIFRNNAVWTLYNSTTILDQTCFKSNGTGGTVYVPQDLISQYEADSNWAVYLGYPNNQILPIEGSQYENYYADGRLINSVL